MKSILQKTSLLGLSAICALGTFATTVQAKDHGEKQERREIKDERHDLKHDQKAVRQERREDHRAPIVRRPVAQRPIVRRPIVRRPTVHRVPVGDGGYNGIVTHVNSTNSFDVRINGKVWNVYLTGTNPRGLSTGDSVRVTGVRVGGNDIRQARTRILRNG